MQFPREPANYDEVSMQQSMLFSDSLKDLKNLRKQLYSAAEYFELSYSNDDQKDTVVDTLKEYAIKALINTVDHLGSVTYKVSDMLDEKVDEVSGTELRLSCIQQRLRTCQEYVDREGLSQQSLVINTPHYHKRYILPTIRATIRETPPPSIVGKKSNFATSVPTYAFRFAFDEALNSERLEFEHTKSKQANYSKPFTWKTSARKSASMRVRVGKEGPIENEQYPSKSKRLLKSLLSRRKSKKDETLYTYLDEY
ncbi:ABL interactor-like protein 3, partial [Striga asiatica]